MNKIKIYIKSIAIPVIIGEIVGFAISSSIDYNSLERPFLSPPSIAFPIVWSILYVLGRILWDFKYHIYCGCCLHHI